MATKPNPRGKRNSPQKKDDLLSKINLQYGPKRYYVFASGKDFGMVGVSADPKEALSEVQVSLKVDLRGVLLEVYDLARAHEILETMSDSLPWKNLNEDIRNDLTLNADWHGCQLSSHEQFALKAQQLETAKERRKKRQKLADIMMRDAEQLRFEK